MNKLGMSITNSHISNPSIEDQIKLFSEIGFDSFFMSSGVTEHFEKIPYWANIAQKCGIEFEALHAPSYGVQTVWLGYDEAKNYIDTMKHIIDMCFMGNVEKLVLHPTCFGELDVSDEGLQVFSLLEEYADGKGVRLCYENCYSATHICEVVKHSGRPHGFCFDVGHNFCYTPDTMLASSLGDRIIYTHLHDNFGDKDSHLLPFDGAVNWNAVIHALKEANYTGTLNLELSCNWDAEYNKICYADFTSRAYECACKLRQMLIEQTP